MDDILLLEAIENYLSGRMNAEEKAYFENLRKTTPEIDQMVVEHGMFLQQMDTYAAHRNLKHTLHETHTRLLDKGDITENTTPDRRARVVQLWRKYKRVTAIAASVAGVIALAISVIVTSVSPTSNKAEVQQLVKKVQNLEEQIDATNKKVNGSKIPQGTMSTNDGSSFLIDTKGYLVTNAHVVKGVSNVVVINSKRQQFNAKIISIDEAKDLALLKIDDEDYHAPASIPYSFKRTSGDLGEQVYTLGYPDNQIVYNEGYLSARNGLDTISYQMSIAANPGNSGGPVLNRNGEIIGVLSARERQAVSVVFAIKNKVLYRFIDNLKKNDSSLEKLKLSTSSSLRGRDRTEQISKLETFVYQVKAF